MQRPTRTPLPARRRRRVRIRPRPGHQRALPRRREDGRLRAPRARAAARRPNAKRSGRTPSHSSSPPAARREGKTGIESFLQQYGLASQEGIMLMCLAEALLRIPDADTADRLIADKIAIGQWSDYLGEADSLFVNASTWGLMLTGKLVRESELEMRDPASFLRRLVARLGEPVVRTAFRQAMRIMGRQFVMGRDIGEALARAGVGRRRALPPHLRHARRVGADRARCAALPRRLSRGDRGGRALGAPGHARPRAGRASRSSCRRCIRATSTGGRARCSRSSGRGSSRSRSRPSPRASR